MKNIFLGIAATALMSVSAVSFAQSADASASASVDVNTATVAELRALGFGKAQAKQIVELAQQDPFDNVAELKAEVKGVTAKSISKLKGKLQVGGELVGGVAGAAGGLLGGVAGAVGGVAGGAVSAGKEVGAAGMGKVTSGVSSAASSMSASAVVDINTATTEQLQGIGFSSDMAAAITANAAKDPIDSVKELKAEVPGVTDAMLGKLSGSLEIGSDLLSVLSNVSGSIKLNGCVNNPACEQ